MMGYFDNGVGEKIAALTPGTEIILLAGEGFPAKNEDSVQIIHKVHGFSALTAEGTRITCFNISDVVLTDRHFDRYPVSEEAKKIEQEVDEMLREQQPELDSEESDENPQAKFKGLNLPNPPTEPE